MAKGKASAKPKAKPPPGAANRIGRGLGGEPDPAYIRAAVLKTISEQFGGLTDHQVASKEVDGQTLLQRVQQDRIDWWNKNDRGLGIKLSGAYYSELRRLYTQGEHDTIVLEWDKSLDENKQAISSDLDAAIDSFLADDRPLRGPLFQWLKTCRSMTNKETHQSLNDHLDLIAMGASTPQERCWGGRCLPTQSRFHTGLRVSNRACLPQEFVVSMRAISTLRPSCNPEQKTGVLVAMRTAKRLKCDEKWPELVGAMRPIFVNGMLAAPSLFMC